MSFSTEGSALSVIDGQAAELLSLEGLETQLITALYLKARLIYWHHGTAHFSYLIGEDKDQWKMLWTQLKDQIRSGRISSVKSANPLVALATGENAMCKSLYPMLVVYMDGERNVIRTGAYFLLKKEGNTEQMDYTPYFFTSKVARDKAFARLTSLINLT